MCSIITELRNLCPERKKYVGRNEANCALLHYGIKSIPVDTLVVWIRSGTCTGASRGTSAERARIFAEKQTYKHCIAHPVDRNAGWFSACIARRNELGLHDLSKYRFPRYRSTV